MTTKEQERKALAQIKKIIADLGEDSYIAIAMEGMIEDAEENIQNDFGCSWKDRAEREMRISDEIRSENVLLKKQNDDLAKKVDALTDAIKTRDGWVEQKNARIDELNKQLEEAADQVCDKIGEVAELLEKIECQKSEIIRLKAKLYDMMTKEEN